MTTRHFETRVTHFRVVANVSSNGPSENIWALYLILEGGLERIHLDMTMMADNRGTLAIDVFDNRLVIYTAIRSWDLPPIGDVTVEMVYQQIRLHALHL